MELSIVEIVTCSTAIVTLFIAILTWQIAKNSLKVAKESNNLAKFQLTERLSLKLYELKDLIDKENGSRLWTDFLSNGRISKEYENLLYIIKDNARANNVLSEKQSNDLVNIYEFFIDKPNKKIELGEGKLNPKDILREYKEERKKEEPNDEEAEHAHNIIYDIINNTLIKLKLP